MYKNVEYIEQKLDGKEEDNSFTYYQLLKEESSLRKSIDDYKNQTAELQVQFSNAIVKNRYQNNTKQVLLKDIENIDNQINYIKNGKIFDEINKSQVLLQYRFIIKFIYFILFINEDFEKFINLTNYKNSIILLYSNNMIFDEYNTINQYKNFVLSLYSNNLISDEYNTINQYKNFVLSLYSNNMISDEYNIINKYKIMITNLYLKNVLLDVFYKNKISK